MPSSDLLDLAKEALAALGTAPPNPGGLFAQRLDRCRQAALFLYQRLAPTDEQG